MHQSAKSLEGALACTKVQRLGMREKFKFWLDLSIEREFVLADKIYELKKQRLFSKTIRDGIELVCDLRGGGVGVLRRMFPDVHEAIRIEGQSEETRQILAALRATGHTNGAKPTPLAAVEDRVDEDEEDPELEIVEVKDGSSARNFLNSMAGLM